MVNQPHNTSDASDDRNQKQNFFYTHVCFVEQQMCNSID